MSRGTFQGARILVTGASSGIGRELALRFAARGARHLVLVARRRDRLEETGAILRDRHGAEATAVPADLADPAAADGIVRDARAAAGGIDVLAINAGIGDQGAFAESDPVRVRTVIDVNVTTHCRMARALAPEMVERRRGGILAVASLAGLQPVPSMAIYGATKAFLVHFLQALHEELRDRGVHVTCVCPGPVRTAFFDANDVRLPRKTLRRALPAERVARVAVDALARNRPLVVPGLVTSLLALVPRFLPRRLANRLARAKVEGRLRDAERQSGRAPDPDRAPAGTD